MYDPSTAHSEDILRPATIADIPLIRARLLEAIEDSPYYGSAFKAHEKARFTENYLLALLAADPWYVTICQEGGVAAGFAIGVPEFGTLWSPWLYVFPEYRRSTLALKMVRLTLAHWNHGRFHKIACYVRPDNKAAITLFTRLGFERIALLKEHIFGEDVLLLEHRLTKTREGYDKGVSLGRIGLMRFRLREVLNRRTLRARP